MLVTWVAQLEIEAELSHSITNVEVEFSLAKASGPDFHNFIEATQKEGFFCIVTREHLLLGKRFVVVFKILCQNWLSWWLSELKENSAVRNQPTGLWLSVLKKRYHTNESCFKLFWVVGWVVAICHTGVTFKLHTTTYGHTC